MGLSPWDGQESDMTEHTQKQQQSLGGVTSPSPSGHLSQVLGTMRSRVSSWRGYCGSREMTGPGTEEVDRPGMNGPRRHREPGPALHYRHHLVDRKNAKDFI